MTKIKGLLDAHLAQLAQAEPYFAPNFQAARVLLDSALDKDGGLRWASGATCGPRGCSCGNKACLHATAWRLYVGK
jgi:hypothetical protein